MTLFCGSSAYATALACDNGRDYVFRPQAVSYDTEIVTGHLQLRRRTGPKLRLIPTGTGFRYAGRGIWIDGRRDLATIHFGKSNYVSCIVAR